ncbi:hypothetical protein Nepgr_028181 [Nepenthes gracilis]|uniref:Uncharacterized protein n=1 Tax=Nepenthes gracilis TaxID=150966 RepID=A0AAD3Y263_NEPGR|nr:hypothetical protein Nepgr_028181 [Nepenthes gracilis]
MHSCSFDAKAARIIFRFTESEDWVSMSPKAGFPFRGTNPDSVKGWKERFFFLQEPSDSELPRVWGPISNYFQEKPTPEDFAESEKLLAAIKSEGPNFSIQGYYLTSVTFEISRWGPPVGWAAAGPGKEGPEDAAAPPPSGGAEEESCSLLHSSSGDEDTAALKRIREVERTSSRRSRRRVAGPSVVIGSPAPKRRARADRQQETAKPSSTPIVGLATREVCEVESLPTVDPSASFAAGAAEDVVILESPEGPFTTAPEPAPEAWGSVESPAILVEPISAYRPSRRPAAFSEVGAAPTAVSVQVDEGEAGTSSGWHRSHCYSVTADKGKPGVLVARAPERSLRQTALPLTAFLKQSRELSPRERLFRVISHGPHLQRLAPLPLLFRYRLTKGKPGRPRGKSPEFPTAAGLSKCDPPQRAEGAEPQGEALSGDLAPSPSAAPA